jgi:hypothetical protein
MLLTVKTIKMVEDGDIKPIVDLIYSFDDGIDAMNTYRQSTRKVIIAYPK